MYNDENLPVIHTARDLEKINMAVQANYKIVLKRVETNPSFARRVEIYRDTQTGKYQWGQDDNKYHPNLKLVLPEFEYHPPMFQNPFAAYLVPKDLVVGTRVWIKDLIEDYLGRIRDWNQFRLESAPAVWNGIDFDIEYDPVGINTCYLG